MLWYFLEWSIPVPRKWYGDENGVKHPIPAPRRKHLLGSKIPIPAPRTKIGEKRRALNGYTKSYEIGIKSNFSALEQLQNTRLAISRYFGDIFSQLGGFTFVETLVVNFVKPRNNEEKWKELAKRKTNLGNKINFVHDVILKNQLGEQMSKESFQRCSNQ